MQAVGESRVAQRANLGGRTTVARVDPRLRATIGEALALLELCDARAARVVRLRWVDGRSVEETAATLGVSVRCARREWSYARARLSELLGSEQEGAS